MKRTKEDQRGSGRIYVGRVRSSSILLEAMSEITGRLSTALSERYQIERRLGEGGMATVYLAEDLKFSIRDVRFSIGV